MEKAKWFTIPRVFLAVIVLAVFSLLTIVFYRVSQFYETQDAFSGAITRSDQLAARDYLQNLQYFYELNKKLRPLGLDGVINERFFKNAQHYQSAYDYLTGHGRCEKILNELKDDDSYWGRYMRANCRWRIAQGIFEKSLDKNKDEKTRTADQKQSIEMAASTKDDYEWVIKNDPASTLPPKWNYDLTADPSAMARALGPKPIKIKVVLGEGGKDKGPKGDKGEGPEGKGTLDLDKKGGDKPSQSPNPDAKRGG
ncbi:MAG: hypothetical protein HYX20_02205 [Candidatus Yanofskybacteria bacterium]|nr:hypothetical protein [Candidatus Yanofskybacteria bacterium]